MMRYMIAFIVMVLSLNAFGAPGEIAQSPVIDSSAVKPNIMLILDDSGSMSWEDTLNKGVEKLRIHEDLELKPTSSYVEGFNIYSFHSNKWVVNQVSGPVELNKKTVKKEQVNAYMKLATCPGFNVLAYNENKIYTIPSGRSKPTAADIDKLSNLFYYHWKDEDADNKYDVGECGLKWRPDDDDDEWNFDFYNSYFKEIENLSQADQANYARWFYHHRDRMKVAQSALSKVVSFGSARIGFNTLHKRNEQIVEDVEKNNHRKNVIDSIFAVSTQGGTPLRSTLKRVGEYFKGTDSPILSAEEGGMCQQNFAILMSDGYWNGSNPGAGNQDGIVNGLVRKSDSDIYSNTLADVAMKYYKEDLKGNLDNLVPIIPGVDENTAQHLVTYTVSFGVDGELTENPAESDNDFEWPEPVKNTLTTIDDMRHAAWNSRGQFLSAADPDALNIALNSIIQNISARSTSTSSLEVVGKESSGDNVMIQTTYDPTNWKGDVIARSLNKNDSVSDIEWTFSQWLKSLENRYLKRRILTINPLAVSDKAFAFSTSNIDKMSTIQQQDLARLSRSTNGGLIDYLKGDAQYEGSKFRARNGHYLGDIVGSYPTTVGTPVANYPASIASTAYSTFRAAYKNRSGMVYVGANDGMLHAIDLGSGAEKFAFMPHGIFSAAPGEGVRQLAKKDYVHRFYVNATPTARDAFVQFPGEEAKSWHTLLTGGLGAGGKSVYLLDITDPDSFATASPGDIVKWEFSHDDLGYSFSEVQIAKLNDGRWYAIFGNSYNADSDGHAKLFVVDIENPEDFVLLDTGIGSIGDDNGLSSPEIADVDGDGVVDWVYAGDLHGNLWTFDLTRFNGQASSAVTRRLFQSCAAELVSGECPLASRQPITTKPALARNPRFAASKAHPNVNVFWGTGQLLATIDKQDTSQQTFYSVLHRGDGLRRYRSDLVGHVFTGIGDKNDARTVNGQRVNYTDAGSEGGVKFGWYLPLHDAGERLIQTPSIRGDLVAFNTTVPVDGGNPCVAKAQGWINALNLLDGLTPQRVGGNNQVFDYNKDGTVDSQDKIGESTVLAIKVDGEPTAPKFSGNTQHVGLGASQSTPGGVQSLLMNFGDGQRAGRSAWFQLR
ncbi:pilus assembly protein [Pistricoccus aurantiacus]|uniref:pilus assembly protein n=1 Tax=Pistricoccus aurantiacus TaxID=1883414 RepID=UPI003637384B